MLRMVRWERWLTLAVLSLSAFALTVWLGRVALPWGQEASVGTATGAGAVLAALILTWGNSWAGVPTSPPPPLPMTGGDWVVKRPEEADEAIRALLRRSPGGDVGTTTGLHGAGGFGKTTLAEVVSGSPFVRRHFRGGVYQFTMGRDIRTRAAIAAKVNEVVQLVTGDTTTFEDPQLAGQHLGRLLSAQPGTLLVIDDVWHADQLEPFLYGGKHCARLVTTRIASSLPGDAVRVQIDRMTFAQAQQVLTWDLPAMPPELTEQLLDACGKWPLLLRLTNRILAADLDVGRPLETAAAEVLARLQAAGPAAVDPPAPPASSALPGDAAEPHPKAVRATIEASVRLLVRNGAARFHELGVFAEDEAVPIDLVTRLWQTTAGLDPMHGRQLCRDLADLSLVTLRPSAGALSLHDVVREYLRGELGAERLTRLSAALLEAAAGGLPAAEPLTSGEPCPRTAWWLADSSYIGDHLITHLLDAGRSDEAEAVAGDLRWVEARLAHHGPSAPYADLSRIPTELAAARAGTLARAAHLLAPTRPEHSLASVLHSHIRHEPCWQNQAFRRQASLPRPHLSSRWPLPDLLGQGLKRTLTGHTDRVSCVAVAHDGSWLASASWDHTVRLWDARTGQQTRTLTGHTNIVTGIAIAPDDTWLVTTSWDHTARVWDTRTGEEIHTLTGHTDIVTAVAVAPGGTWFATTGDQTVRLWNVRTGRHFRTLTGHTDTVTAVAVAPGGNWLATGGADRTLRLWNANSGRQERSLTGHTGSITGVAVAPDGDWLATTGEDHLVQIWDAETSLYGRTLTGHSERVTGLAFTAEGTQLATTSADHTTRLWDIRSGHEIHTLTGHRDTVTGVAIAPDGTWLATTGADRTVRLWDIGVPRRGRSITRHNRRVTGLALAPDGSWLAASSTDRTVQIWDTGTGRHMRTLTGNTSRVTGVAIAPDGSWLATSGTDRTVQIWDTDSGRHMRTLTGDTSRVTGVAIAPDGSWLATSSADRAVQIWDTETGRLMRVLAGHTRAVADVAVAPDGSWLATACHDHTARLWNTGTGRQLHVLAGHTDRVTAVAVAADGKWIATAGADRTARLWDAESGEEIHTFTAHTDRITGVVFSPDNAFVATTSWDHTVRLWDTAGGDCAAMMRLDDDLGHCASSLAGDALAVAGKRGIYLFDISRDTTGAVPGGS